MLLLLLLLYVSTARAVQLVPHASGALVPADTGPVRAARQRHLAALERAAQAEDITWPPAPSWSRNLEPPAAARLRQLTMLDTSDLRGRSLPLDLWPDLLTKILLLDYLSEQWVGLAGPGDAVLPRGPALLYPAPPTPPPHTGPCDTAYCRQCAECLGQACRCQRNCGPVCRRKCCAIP